MHVGAEDDRRRGSHERKAAAARVHALSHEAVLAAELEVDLEEDAGDVRLDPLWVAVLLHRGQLDALRCDAARGGPALDRGVERLSVLALVPREQADDQVGLLTLGEHVQQLSSLRCVVAAPAAAGISADNARALLLEVDAALARHEEEISKELHEGLLLVRSRDEVDGGVNQLAIRNLLEPEVTRISTSAKVPAGAVPPHGDPLLAAAPILVKD
mmetsp:Transcript_51497/g.112109  ORF Transcript_51497/g.112109 Transcript_51497/m.112109 type:complete len:215 (-) Transcript_51497:2068-2712(-)